MIRQIVDAKHNLTCALNLVISNPKLKNPFIEEESGKYSNRHQTLL